MLMETGKIVRLEGDSIWVQTARQSVCGACQARKGCGQNLLNQLVGESAHLRFSRSDYNIDLQEGDHVEIGIEEGAVVAASLLAYGLPLGFLLLAIVVAGALQASGLGSLLLSVVGLCAGIAFSRLFMKNRFHPGFFEPVLVRRVSQLP